MAYITDPSKVGRKRKLKGKMLAFAEAYVTNPKMNGSEAVRQAGYKCKPGNENRLAVQLLRHPLVRQYVTSVQDRRREQMELTQDYVLGNLMEIAENTKEGNPQAALRAYELLGKHLGLYRDRQEISGPDGDAIKYEQQVKENVDEFTNKISRLSQRGEVVPLKKVEND